jgi:hypothetical protein
VIVQLIEKSGYEFEVKEETFEEHKRLLDARTSRMIWMDPDYRSPYGYVNRGRVQSMNAWAPAEHSHAMTLLPQLDTDFNRK